MRAREKETKFAAAIEQHRDALYRVCCAYVRDEADRQDIYQEVLIHIWRSLDTFRGQSNLGTWLYRVAVNTCLGWLRREKRRSQMLERACAEQQVVAAGSCQTGPAVAEDDVQQLYSRIAELAPVDRLLVSLYLEEMDSAEMAAVLGISEGNVRVKLHRIKNQLREMWEKEDHEPR
jgi:RNA polymerase sigma-70 factor (ECF subfamily)